MRPLFIKENKNFIGRCFEIATLNKIATSKEAVIVVTYGRRRVGKTELLEQVFKERNILKIEGIAGLTNKEQFASAMRQLTKYIPDLTLKPITITTWSEFFLLLANYLKTGKWTLYLEELQWLSNYESTLISELKYVWDNYFRYNPELIILLCGSSPSFMIDQVIHSKALYNRSQHEIHLKEFTISETKLFLKNRSVREIFDAYLTIGGIPEYLKWINKDSSVFLSLCKHSFTAGSFFSHEYEKIFTSSMASNKYYKKIIEILSKKKFVTRLELAKMLNINSGGSLSNVLLDLEKCGFINKYHPFNLKEGSVLTRYSISDNYLQYYFKFIKSLQKNIDNGDYNQNPQMAIKVDNYIKWLGFSFERFCRKFHGLIAKILGFSGVKYEHGVYFSRSTEKSNPGYQIDLIFNRADHVYTVCEIKYLQIKVSTNIIDEFEKKIALLPVKSNKTIHKVLICNMGAEKSLLNRAYFDNIITCDDIIAASDL